MSQPRKSQNIGYVFCKVFVKKRLFFVLTYVVVRFWAIYTACKLELVVDFFEVFFAFCKGSTVSKVIQRAWIKKKQ